LGTAKNTQIYEGTNQIQRVVMSRALLKWPSDPPFVPLPGFRAGARQARTDTARMYENRITKPLTTRMAVHDARLTEKFRRGSGVSSRPAWAACI
jgi:hypothetical protein